MNIELVRGVVTELSAVGREFEPFRHMSCEAMLRSGGLEYVLTACQQWVLQRMNGMHENQTGRPMESLDDAKIMLAPELQKIGTGEPTDFPQIFQQFQNGIAFTAFQLGYLVACAEGGAPRSVEDVAILPFQRVV